MLKGFFLKFVTSTIILTVVYHLFFHYALSSTLLLSLLFTVIAFIGDVFIMPRISHFLAIGTDFILAFFGLALLSWFVYPVTTVPWLPAFLAALIIMVAEIFFHRYLLEQMKAKRVTYS
ncbi:signal transduction histidine kinase [Alkalihalobacillus xiaoxiensis]|uniref:Signal transduction histidine kinase n=1 Tax=Shouchella xiaoxiensis TaxID=766895 RepID=A0ABS2SY30_9BACI|nr:DUF2512 family protein [Shouchella xiaoxiensis]MBM7839936.1 signal transduction histidine kinase [Shouchella xiaoxiensis]